MGYRYIGSKTNIIREVISVINKTVRPGGRVADLMSGIGIVSTELRRLGYRVTANDLMSQAYHMTRAKLLLQSPPLFEGLKGRIRKSNQLTLDSESRYSLLIQTMNYLEPIKGYFWREFSPDGSPQNGSVSRKYFTSENAMKIDASRLFLRELLNDNLLTSLEESLIIHDMINAVNDIANIAGTYGHYLSKFQSRSLMPIVFKSMNFIKGGISTGHLVYNEYAEDLASSIEADLCYIDPPYTKRQYAANYHLLETIAKGDEPIASGKSGLRSWRDQYSNFCSKVKFGPSLEKIISNVKCDNFIISYSSEGLFSVENIKDFLTYFGTVKTVSFPNKRFKSRNESANHEVTEYLFILKKNQ